METLFRITSELSASLDLDRVLNRALTLVVGAIGAPRGSILLVDPQTDTLIHRAALGRKPATLPPGGAPTPFRRGEGLAGWVIQKPALGHRRRRAGRRALDQETGRADPRLSLGAGRAADGQRRCAGRAAAVSTRRRTISPRDHLRLVEAAARQVATAINNAELYRLIREQAERLGSMLRAQQEEASKSQAILEAVADGVMVANAQGRVILFNAAAERILGAQRDEIVGRPMDDLLGLYGAAGVTWMQPGAPLVSLGRARGPKCPASSSVCRSRTAMSPCTSPR